MRLLFRLLININDPCLSARRVLDPQIPYDVVINIGGPVVRFLQTKGFIYLFEKNCLLSFIVVM